MTISLYDASLALRKDLELIDPTNPNVVVVGHDGIDTINVYCTPKHAAYVPKKYLGWDVRVHKLTDSAVQNIDGVLSYDMTIIWC